MPTGYTAKLVEKGQSFKDFAMGCARAFGACIEMRDVPVDAPIPDKFEPSSYYTEALAKNLKELKRLEAMTAAERRSFGEKEKAENVRAARASYTRNEVENQRINDMIARVAAWTPPTDEHVELKQFMLDQLTRSLNDMDDCTRRCAAAEDAAPLSFYGTALASVKCNIDYDEKEIVKERERAEGRTAWIEQLRNSLEEGTMGQKRNSKLKKGSCL